MRTTSAQVGKAYSAAGQAAACLHTMSRLQAYQAELLADLDEGGGIGPKAICKLHRATDLSFRVAKETAKSIGRSMANLVATERHLWLNLSNINGKDTNFLMDAPISSSGLFGDAVNSVVERFQESAKHTAAFQKLIPRHTHIFGAANQKEQPQTSKASSSVPHRNREWPIMLPHLKYGDTGSAINRSLRRVKWILGPMLFLRGRDPDPPEVEWSTPHFTVPVSLRCPQGIVLLTLPPRVLQLHMNPETVDGALGVERQRTGSRLGSGSEPALELLWWKGGRSERGHRICTSLQQGNRVLQPVYPSSNEG